MRQERITPSGPGRFGTGRDNTKTGGGGIRVAGTFGSQHATKAAVRRATVMCGTSTAHPMIRVASVARVPCAPFELARVRSVHCGSICAILEVPSHNTQTAPGPQRSS